MHSTWNERIASLSLTFFLIFRHGSIIVFLRYYACWEGFVMADAKAKTINLLLYEGDLEGVIKTYTNYNLLQKSDHVVTHSSLFDKG